MASPLSALEPYAEVVQELSPINQQSNPYPPLKKLSEGAPSEKGPVIATVPPPPMMVETQSANKFLPQLLGFPSNENKNPPPPPDSSVLALATELQGVIVAGPVALEVIRSAQRVQPGLPLPQDNRRPYGLV